MLPRIRSKSQQNIKIYDSPKSLKQWNDRCILQTMPEYSPKKDPHLKKYKQIKIQQKKNKLIQSPLLLNVNIKRSQSIVRQVNKQENSSPVSNRRMSQSYPNQINKSSYTLKAQKIIQLLQKISPQITQDIAHFYKVISSHSISESYIYYLFKSYLRKTKLNRINQKNQFNLKFQMLKQTKEIKNKQTHFYKINGCWLARIKVIDMFQKFIKQKIQNQVEVLDHKDKLKQLIKTMRLISANLVQVVMKWRQYLNLQQVINTNQDQLHIFPQKPISYFNHQNMLIIILSDNKFFLQSTVANCIEMGTKNDPFLISPLMNANGKQKSEYLLLFELSEQQILKYKDLMKYLANQKAYDMKNNNKTKLIKRSKSEIEKIYLKNNKSKLEKSIKIKENYIQNQQKDDQLSNLQRSRIDRQRKNKKRINQLKQAYNPAQASLSKKIKDYEQDKNLLENEIEIDKRQIKKQKTPKNKTQLDNQFDFLVRERYNLLTIQMNKKGKQGKFVNVLTQQDKMIKNLRSMNEQLKQKLKMINQQTDSSALSPTRFVGKTHKQIVDTLKKQIITKIQKQQKQKNKIKSKRKQQQLKILQQVQQKIKKQMDDKLNQKKRQKLQQRQKLQNILNEQQQKIKKQKQLQIQMLAKINKQKQLKQIQKVKRQALQKQIMLKQQLAKQRMMLKEKQQMIEKQKQQKQKLLRQIQKMELKEQLERQIKQKYTQKNKFLYIQKINQNNSQDFNKNQLNKQSNLQKFNQINQNNILNQPQQNSTLKIKQQYNEQRLEKLKFERQFQIRKQLENLKSKKDREINLLSKENDLRQRMLNLKKNQQQIVHKQIDYLIKSTIILDIQKSISSQPNQDRQYQMKRYQITKQIQKQEEQERIKQKQLLQIQKQKAIQQELYRQKIKQKIQNQLRSQAIKRTKKQMEERQQRQYQRRKQQSDYRIKLFNQKSIDKTTIEQDQKEKIINSPFLVKQIEQQNAKTSLRSQFQKQLLASSLPPKYYQQKDQYLKIKNTQHYLDDEHLTSKLKQNNKQSLLGIQQKISQNRKQIKQHIFELTDQQLHVYRKQKSKNKQMMQNQYQINPIQQKIEDEQYQSVNLKQQQREYNPKIKIKNTIKNLSKDKQVFNKIKPIKKYSEDQRQSINRESTLAQSKVKSIKNGIMDKHMRNKHIGNIKQKSSNKNKQDIQQSDNNQRKPSHAKLSKNKQSKQKYKKQPQNQNSHTIQSSQNELIHSHVKQSKQQKPKLKQYKSIEPITYKKLQKEHSKNNKYNLQFQAVLEDELDHYLQTHLNRLPIQQTVILPINRDQLYKKLVNQLTFSLIIGTFENKMVGMAYIYHDRHSVQSQVRRFVIAHIGTYDNKKLQSFIYEICQFILLKDPCDEIQFIYTFDEKQQTQLSMSKQLSKWFDQYGSIYQKKLQTQKYLRKFVYKRKFNHKCEVVLNGVNKNIFKNIFSINAGIVISQSPLIRNKQYFQQKQSSHFQPILQNKMSIILMLSQIFRMYMTPQQAQILKNKVKQNTKLKQLLLIVVTLQKKKIKLQQYRLSQYKTIMELNMKLMSQGKQTIKYVNDNGAIQNNQIFYNQLLFRGNLPFNFQIASLPVTSISNDNTKTNRYLNKKKTTLIQHINYFRMSPFADYRLHLVKSSLYSTQMFILPTQNSKNKILIMNAQQYLQIRQKQKQQSNNQSYNNKISVDLYTYIKIFMKNVSKYSQDTQYNNIWLPQISTLRQVSNIKQYNNFYPRQIFIHDSINMSYKQFIPNGLIIQPSHRDLVITAPFIIGVLSMNIQQVLEGCPIYAKIIGIDGLKTMEIQQ